MNHFLTSSLRNSPITLRRSVSSHLLVSVYTTRFSKNDVGSSSTLPANDLDVIISLSYLDCPQTIYLTTCLSLFMARFFTSSGTIIFYLNLGRQISLLSDSLSLLLLLLSPLLGLFLILFSQESGLLVSFPFPCFYYLEFLKRHSLKRTSSKFPDLIDFSHLPIISFI